MNRDFVPDIGTSLPLRWPTGMMFARGVVVAGSASRGHRRLTGQFGDHLAFAREDAVLIVEGDRAEMLDHELRHCVVTGRTSRADYQKRLRAHHSSPEWMVEVAQMRG